MKGVGLILRAVGPRWRRIGCRPNSASAAPTGVLGSGAFPADTRTEVCDASGAAGEKCSCESVVGLTV